MKSLRVVLTDAAESDILEQFDWYEAQVSKQLGQKWGDAIAATLIWLQRHPHSGAVCIFGTKELFGMRRVAVQEFPRHLMFYQIEGEELLIIRVLHGARDLESLF